jgi:hypothetical protein
METSSKSEAPKEIQSLREVLTNLVDAVRYAQHANETEAKKRKVEEDAAAQIQKIDGFVVRLSTELDDLVSELGSGNVEGLTGKVSKFVQVAMEQTKFSISHEAERKAEELSAAASLERTRALKSLEAFLASTPLPVIESVVSVKLVDSVYVSKCRYHCEGNIDYEFSLGTQNSRLFQQQFRLAELTGQLKVPVRLGKTWSRREPIPHFERLDRYILTSAELTDRNLMIELEAPDGGSRFRIVHSKGTTQDFSSIEFSEERGTVNVLEDPGLNIHVDFKAIKSTIDEISAELASLEKNRITLARLLADGDDVLEELAVFRFLQNVLETMQPTYRTIIGRISAGEALGSPEALLDLRMVKQRVKLLGQDGKAVSDLLGVRANV